MTTKARANRVQKSVTLLSCFKETRMLKYDGQLIPLSISMPCSSGGEAGGSSEKSQCWPSGLLKQEQALATFMAIANFCDLHGARSLLKGVQRCKECGSVSTTYKYSHFRLCRFFVVLLAESRKQVTGYGNIEALLFFGLHVLCPSRRVGQLQTPLQSFLGNLESCYRCVLYGPLTWPDFD